MGQKNKKIKNGSPSAVFVSFREEVLPRVPGTRYSGKGSLPRVLQIRHSGKHFFVVVFLPQFFCEAFKHYLKLLAQIWLTFEFFCYISLVFSFS
jgi:hypothetical protein